MQVKIIVGDTLAELENSINEFLEGLDKDPKSVHCDLDNCSAVIGYDKANKEICCDCKWWDAEHEDLIGLCQRCGKRKRFSDKSCNNFEDVRW